MRTLVHLPAVGIDPIKYAADSVDELTSDVEKAIINFLFDISDSDVTSSDISLGRDNPELMNIKIAAWNENLIHRLRSAVSILYAKPMDWIHQADRCEKVAQAASDMANHWTVDSEYLVIDFDDIGQPCAKTLLTPEQDLSIKEHPGEWAFTYVFLYQSDEVRPK